MAASATSLSTFSSLSLHHPSRRFSLPTTSLSLTSSSTTPLYYSPLSLSTTNTTKIHYNANETVFLESEDPDDRIPHFTPEVIPEDPDDLDSNADDAEVTESLEDIIAGYEELYGPAYSGVSVLGNDINVMDKKISERLDGFGTLRKDKIRDGFGERVVQVRRVNKVVKGGKQLHFRAVVVVGDKRGKVGVGVGKAKDVGSAVQKAAYDGRRNVILVPLTKHLTFPHRANGKYGAAEVMLRPGCPGTGVIAGGAVKIVLEMAGLENALGKQIRSNNALNNARATLVAIMKMTSFSEVSKIRGIPMEEMWK